MLVTGSGGSAGNNVSWSLRVSSDGRALSLTGTDSDRTSLELNRSLDNAYKIPNASDPRYLIILNKIIRRQKVEGVFPQPDPELGTISQAQGKLLAKTFLPDPSTVSTCVTSKLNRVVHVEDANSKALAAIRAITPKPHGIFCVDLKGDEQGIPKPTEINCRFTTNVHYLTLASVKFGKPEWNFPWLAGRMMLHEPFPRCKELDALPSNLWFTKNVDMGYTIVEDENWRAAEVT